MDLQRVDSVVSDTSSPRSASPEIPRNAPAGAAKAPVSKTIRKNPKQRTIKCHVTGCKHNLVKAYDKKARTCSQHRKETQVELDGVLHRFCQQCSRFHPLAEFDGDRKNCRQRLQQHNRRQRKMRMLRRPSVDDDSYDGGSHQSQYTMVTPYEGQQGFEECANAVTAVAEPCHLLASESTMPSEMTATDDTLLSSVELDSLLGSFTSNYDGGNAQQRMLVELGNAVLAEPCNILSAEDVWVDDWFKPALGAPAEYSTSPLYFGGAAPHGGI